MIILGIDPGTRFAGYVIFKKDQRQLQLLDYGVLTLAATKPLPDRVAEFYDFFKNKIEIFNVSDIAFETPFVGEKCSKFFKTWLSTRCDLYFSVT